MSLRHSLEFAGVLLLLPLGAVGGERPYFVTYDHHLEEPGSLELSVNPVVGLPRTINHFVGSTTEFEYGLKGWWTTEFYLDGQKTSHDSTVFTGFRWENRFRPLMREHWINPVLYVEFVKINAADKSLKEVVGHDSEKDFRDPNSEARRERKREIETRLILSSNWRGWNFAENFIAEKNLANEPWEFGYALGASRPLALAASPQPCKLCRENFSAGVEFYGGLGNGHEFGFPNTSHYVGPILAWRLSNGTDLKISPNFGLTRNSQRTLIRITVSYEFARFDRRIRQLFH